MGPRAWYWPLWADSCPYQTVQSRELARVISRSYIGQLEHLEVRVWGYYTRNPSLVTSATAYTE
jgi:hypothetical protein